VTAVQAISDPWKKRLGLLSRQSPEFYENAGAVVDTPHAVAIRSALDELGLSGVLCVQGVPTIAMLQVDEYDPRRVVDIHGALWNQGLASLLLVITQDTLRAFSLARMPQREWGQDFDKRCLVAALNATTHALEVSNLIYGAESGRLWKEHAEYFNSKERIDEVLLGNLNESHLELCKANLGTDAAQALLIQAMFIAYLEDREIITSDYFEDATRKKAGSFSALLETRDVKLLKRLFATLRDDFNGDLFVAPCSFESAAKAPTVTETHLDVLARFRSGREDMSKGGQFRFWGYDFRYIPIELVSAVYDRFLGEREDERKAQGAYYTPMFLADSVVSQLWDVLPAATREKGHFLDPACGSGVFLVRSFQRLCENWRTTRQARTIRWDSLLSILKRVHGWDLNGSAVRVAVFSLYVALLEEVSPPDIRAMVKRGKLLPELWGKTLVRRDFFVDPDKELASFEVLIGNPPWSSRRGGDRPSLRWSNKNNAPMPSGEDAWAFVWKSLKHLRPGGIVAFLLPAMGFLHNHAANSVEARRKLVRESKFFRVVNFADLRFQLFDGAIRAAALVVFGLNDRPNVPYKFDYWAPKADLNLQLKRMITLSSADKMTLNSATVERDGLAFKHRLWMREPEAKLFSYLSRLPNLSALITDFGSLRRLRADVGSQWVIGQGYQPFHGGESGGSSSYQMSKFVGHLPDLPINAFCRLAQSVQGLKPARSRRVRRVGFEAGFSGTRILVPQGVETTQWRLRASYTEDDLTFQHILQAIAVPSGQKARAKLLTAILNSRLSLWFAFHGTASFGTERPKVQQAELLTLPFPDVDDLPEPERAKKAGAQLVKLIDREVDRVRGPFQLGGGPDDTLLEIDRLTYEYFCLSDSEITLIEDTVTQIIPATQPHQGSYPQLWKAPTQHDRESYARTLVSRFDGWLKKGVEVNAALEASNADLAVLRLSLDGAKKDYVEEKTESLQSSIARLAEHIHRPLDGNFQLLPDLRVFVGNDLFLIKPMQKRFWLKSTALADADAVAQELETVVDIARARGRPV
jgi:N-6 DNA Methylase